MVSIPIIVIYFVVYSFLGWVHEILFHLITIRKIHLQGFMFLPLLPIYGFGALGILAATHRYADDPFLVFLSASLVATVLELVTSTFLEKVFHLRLWDYSGWPLNYKGKVGLFSSLGFGLLGLFLMYVFQPFLSGLMMGFDAGMVSVTGWILFVIVAIDYTNSTVSLIRLRVDMNRVRGAIDDIQKYIEQRALYLHRAGSKIPLAVQELHAYNIRHLRRAFPGLQIINKTERKAKRR